MEAGSITPCRKAIKAEMVVRVNIAHAFCGLCTWNRLTFTCYQRVGYLVAKYAMGRADAQRGLLTQVHCGALADVDADLQA